MPAWEFSVAGFKQWSQGFKWWDCPVNKQVFHGPTQIHLTFMFSKCGTIRMPGEEVEQNLEFWVHPRACGFLLCPSELRQPQWLSALQPWGKKNPPCAPGRKNAARALRFKDFAYGVWDILEKLASCLLIIFLWFWLQRMILLNRTLESQLNIAKDKKNHHLF